MKKLPRSAKWVLLVMAAWATFHAYPSAKEKKVLIVARRLGDNMVNTQWLVIPATNTVESVTNQTESVANEIP